MSEYGIARWEDICDADRLPIEQAIETGRLIPMGFGIAWNGGAATGTDIAGHRLISLASAPSSVTVRAEVAPVDYPLIIDIRRVRESSPISDVSILSAPISRAAGNATATGALAAGMTFEAGDYLTVTASQSGGTAPQNVFIEIQVRLS